MEGSAENSISSTDADASVDAKYSAEENEIEDSSKSVEKLEISGSTNAGESKSPDSESQRDSDSLESVELDMVDITPDNSGGVLKQVRVPGDGDEVPAFGDRVYVHYTGWLLNKEQKMIDSNRKGDKLEFNLGRGMVINGWDFGVSTMKKGEVAIFIIQPDYAYGDMGYPPTIPPHTPLLFEIELYEWKLDDISPKKDGSILRKVIDKGEGTTSPNELSEVKVKLVGSYENRVFEEREEEFILGEGCSANIVEGIEHALYRFHLNEKSLIYVKSKYGFEKGSEEFNIPPDATITYEVTLLNFAKAKEVWEMNSDEKFEKSKVAKYKGVEFVKAGRCKAALRQFRCVLACLEKEPGAPPETQEDRNALLLSAYLNIALCLLKMENYVDAIKFCDKAIEMDPENEKALYRRGQAKMLFNDCEEALEDFKKLHFLYPKNKAAINGTFICQEKIKKQKVKDKTVYNKMFEIFMKQDEERMKSMKTETGVWEGEGETAEEADANKTETQRIIERNNNFLRDANVIELSNTAF